MEPTNTFYRYFANKDAILQYLLEDTLINLLEIAIHMENNNHINMVEYFAYWLQHYRKYDSLWSIVQSGDKHDMLLTLMVKYYVKLSDPSIKEDFNNLHTKQIIFLSYGMQGILDVWRYTGYEQSEEEVAKQLYKLFQTPMLQLHPTGERARELIKKHKEHNYFIEEYKAVH